MNRMTWAVVTGVLALCLALTGCGKASVPNAVSLTQAAASTAVSSEGVTVGVRVLQDVAPVPCRSRRVKPSDSEGALPRGRELRAVLSAEGEAKRRYPSASVTLRRRGPIYTRSLESSLSFFPVWATDEYSDLTGLFAA